MGFLSEFIVLLTQVLTFAIFFRAIMTWLPIGGDNPLVALVYQITEPILAPLRQVIPRLGMIDITPFVAIIILQIIRGIAA